MGVGYPPLPSRGEGGVIGDRSELKAYPYSSGDTPGVYRSLWIRSGGGGKKGEVEEYINIPDWSILIIFPISALDVIMVPVVGLVWSRPLKTWFEEAA